MGLISSLTKSRKFLSHHLAFIGVAVASLVTVGALIVVTLSGGQSIAYAGAGTPQDPYLISSCEQLQAMSIDRQSMEYGDVDGHYALTADIDCSASRNWTWESIGAPSSLHGFMPIYDMDNDADFQGSLDGRGHTISGLYMESYVVGLGLFAKIDGGTFTNIKLADIEYHVNMDSSFYDFNSPSLTHTIGGFAGTMKNVTASGISITGTIEGTFRKNTTLGGFVGFTNDANSTIEYSYTDVDINVTRSVGGANPYIHIGGFFGIDVATTSPTLFNNIYTHGNVQVNNSNGATSLGGIGGSALSTRISNVYSSGNLTIVDATNDSQRIGGLLGGIAGEDIQISNVFSVSSITTPNLTPGTGGTFGVGRGGLFGVWVTVNDNSIDVSGSHYDVTRTGLADCFGVKLDFTQSPTVVSGNTFNSMCVANNTGGSQPNQFINNTTNAPLSAWNFSSIWKTRTLTYPDFVGEASTPTPTPTPTSTVTPSPTASPVATPTPTPTPTPIITTETTTPSPSPDPSVSPTATPVPGFQDIPDNRGGQKKSTAIVRPRVFFGLLPASSLDSVRQVPESIAVAIPYLLLLVLAAIATLYSRQAWIEHQNQKRSAQIVQRYRDTKIASQNFVGLVSHYLNTPIGTMQLSLGLLTSQKHIDATLSTKLGSAIQMLAQDTKKLIMDSQALNQNVQEISKDMERTQYTSPWRSAFVWVPITAVAFIIGLVHIIFTDANKYNLTFANLAVQILCFVLLALALALAYRSILLNRASKASLEKQRVIERDLMDRRVAFIGQAHKSLDAGLAYIESFVKTLVLNDATRPLFAGCESMRRALNVFGRLAEFSQPPITPPSPLPLTPVVMAAVSALKGSADTKGVTIQTNIPEKASLAMPANAIHQIVFSAIDNAVKFSKSGGKVTVTAHGQKDVTELSIEDTGIGIDPSRLAQLMTPFSRATDVMRFDFEGMGLSLYLDKIVMQQAGGSIDIKSSPGNGTKLTFKFPS